MRTVWYCCMNSQKDQWNRVGKCRNRFGYYKGDITKHWYKNGLFNKWIHICGGGGCKKSIYFSHWTQLQINQRFKRNKGNYTSKKESLNSSYNLGNHFKKAFLTRTKIQIWNLYTTRKTQAKEKERWQMRRKHFFARLTTDKYKWLISLQRAFKTEGKKTKYPI